MALGFLVVIDHRWIDLLRHLSEDCHHHTEVRHSEREKTKTQQNMVNRRPGSMIDIFSTFEDLDPVSSRIQGLRHGRGDVQDLPVSRNLEEGMTLTGVWLNFGDDTEHASPVRKEYGVSLPSRRVVASSTLDRVRKG